MLFDTHKVEFTDINTTLYTSRKIRLRVARLDKIHEVISGNKLYKLHFFLDLACQSVHRTILSFGGAWSNHLLATSYACKMTGLKSIGIVRGELPGNLSATLKGCMANGMQLEFVSREVYRNRETVLPDSILKDQFGECLIVPEGGFHSLGAKGASLIMDDLSSLSATHICTAVGTATTLAGLLQNCPNHETIIAVPVLKNMTDLQERISWLNKKTESNEPVIFDGYHFGGYAKKTKTLVAFMNEFYETQHLPTDFIYTGKMMYAVIDKIRSGYFPENSNIICLHTGGLQGNVSLPAGTLVF